MLKNKIVVRKIRNIVILLMAILVMIGAYRNIGRSKAENVVELAAMALDNYGYLEDEEFKLEAKQLEDDIYEIELPETINSKKVIEYINVTLEDTTIETDSETEQETTTETVEIVENKIQLTKEQMENQKLNIEAVYDVAVLQKDEQGIYNKIVLSDKTEEERKLLGITNETETLYSKVLKYEDEENGKVIELKGYLPEDAQLQIEEVSDEQLKEIFGDAKIDVAYDIKIIVQVITQVPVDEANPESELEEIIEILEINPEDFGETCEVSIKDTNIEENSKVYHVKDDNTVEQVNVTENTEENISFEAQTFSVYLVSTDETLATTSGVVETPSEEEDDEGTLTGAAVIFSPSSSTTWSKSKTITVTASSSSLTISRYLWTTSDTTPTSITAGLTFSGANYTQTLSESGTGKYYLFVLCSGTWYRSSRNI